MDVLKVRVDCRADAAGEPTPQQLRIGRRTLDILEVLDRWLAPDHRYFKVKGRDGATYILRHDMASQVWQLVLFDRSGAI